MPFKDKLKKVLHLEGDEPTSPSHDSQSLTDASIQSTRYQDARQGEFPRQDQRPLSGEGKSPVSPTNAVSNAAPHKTLSLHNARRSEDVMSHARVPSKSRTDRYSENVADSNIAQSNKLHGHDPVHALLPNDRLDSSHPPQLGLDLGEQYDGEQISNQMANGASALSNGNYRKDSTPRKAIGTADTTSHRLNRKANSPDLMERVRESRANAVSEPVTSKRDMAAPGDVTKYSHKAAAQAPSTSERDMAAPAKVTNSPSKADTQAPSLEGIVDLRNTTDTNVAERWAPAVTHETVHRDIHHIREELITREIHTHDVYHRILPIIDVEVLPARHFVPDGKGGRIEISEDEIPGRTGPYRKTWAIVENVSTNEPIESRQFTACQFHGTEGDYKEYKSASGVPTTETTWVHPPTLEEFGEYTGQTVPFYFGSEDPKDDGLRVYAPTGAISGCSRMYAEQNRQSTSLPTDDMSELSLNGDTSATKASGKLNTSTRFL